MRIKDCIATVLLTVGVMSQSVYAAESQLQQALEAYEKKEYATALKLLQPLAERGDVEAQFRLGLMYADGEGVTENDEFAVQWYRKAADQGYANAQYNLGVMYVNGWGVKEDSQQAVYWFQKAAEQDHVRSQYVLGWRYDMGDGVDEDVKQAEYWYRKACDNGYSDACDELSHFE